MWTPFEQHYLWNHILAVFLPPALLQSADSSPPSDQRSVIKENHIVYINIILQIKLTQTRDTAIQIFFIFCITVGWADIILNLCQWGLTAYWWCIIVTFPLKQNDQECISLIMWVLLSKRLSQVWPKLCFLYWHSGTLLRKQFQTTAWFDQRLYPGTELQTYMGATNSTISTDTSDFFFSREHNIFSLLHVFVHPEPMLSLPLEKVPCHPSKQPKREQNFSTADMLYGFEDWLVKKPEVNVSAMVQKAEMKHKL